MLEFSVKKVLFQRRVKLKPGKTINNPTPLQARGHIVAERRRKVHPIIQRAASAQRGRGGRTVCPLLCVPVVSQPRPPPCFSMEMSAGVESISPLALQVCLYSSLHLYSLPGNSHRQKQFKHPPCKAFRIISCRTVLVLN